MDELATATTGQKTARELPGTRYGGVLMAIHDELESLETTYKGFLERTAAIQEQPAASESTDKRDRNAGETRLEDDLLAMLDHIRAISQQYYDLLQRIQL